ncbi:MAG TPA: hypothetical protein DEA96_17760 [Leptospiraceae bacterium]|nr:hypothetical protein [Spirochaetaceae bacterium]HBS06821.1 hypothetical protein [Leptospiraceae bacterium]
MDDSFWGVDQRQKEYTEYYYARMKRYEGNPMYRKSYATEKALYELMRDAKTKEEYQKKFFGEKLNIKNAIALVKDRETARRDHYRKIKEPIREKGSQEILDVVDSFQSEAEISTEIPKLQQKNSVAISVDGFADYFFDDFPVLESLEVARRADVPSRWKDEQAAYIKDTIAKGRADWQERVVPNARQWDPSWSFDYALIQEERHRRRIPLPDSVVKRRLPEHKEYRGID